MHVFFLSNTSPFKKKNQILFNFCSNPILCPLYTGKIVIWCGEKMSVMYSVRYVGLRYIEVIFISF